MDLKWRNTAVFHANEVFDLYSLQMSFSQVKTKLNSFIKYFYEGLMSIL